MSCAQWRARSEQFCRMRVAIICQLRRQDYFNGGLTNDWRALRGIGARDQFFAITFKELLCAILTGSQCSPARISATPDCRRKTATDWLPFEPETAASIIPRRSQGNQSSAFPPVVLRQNVIRFQNASPGSHVTRRDDVTSQFPS